MKRFEPWLKKKAAKSNIALGLYLVCMGATALGYVLTLTLPMVFLWCIAYALGGTAC